MYKKSTPRSYSVKFIDPKYLDCEEKMILMILMSMRNLPEIHLSVDGLSRQASISVPTVQRKLKALIRKGLIERKRYGKGKSTTTRVIDSNIIDLIIRSDPKHAEFFKDPFQKFKEEMSTIQESNDEDIDFI